MFYNQAKSTLQVKDGGGEVIVGPFLQGTEELGPWYSIDEISETRFVRWQRDGFIRLKGAVA